MLMKRVLKNIEWVSEWSGRVFAYLIYPGMAVLVYEVFMRYIFASPTLWAYGTSQRLFASYYLIAGAHVLLHKGHINMDVIYNKLSVRTRAFLDVLTAVFVIGTGFALTWYGGLFAWKSITILERCNSAWNAPVYPAKAMVPIAGFLLMLQAINKLIHDIHTVATGRSYEY